MFEGPYRNIGEWTTAMNVYVRSKGQAVDKLFFYYATCPKCTKQFGVNQVVLIAKVECALDFECLQCPLTS